MTTHPPSQTAAALRQLADALAATDDLVAVCLRYAAWEAGLTGDDNNWGEIVPVITPEAFRELIEIGRARDAAMGRVGGQVDETTTPIVPDDVMQRLRQMPRTRYYRCERCDKLFEKVNLYDDEGCALCEPCLDAAEGDKGQ